MKNTLYIATLATVISFSSVASAASSDLIDNGNYTSDKISGFDWLDVTETLDKTNAFVKDELGSGGIYEGWRYATPTEFVEMVNHYTDQTNTSTGKVNQTDATIGGLLDLFGGQDRGPNNQGASSGWCTSECLYGYLNNGRVAGISYDLQKVGLGATGADLWVKSSYSKITGSFLVRDTAVATPSAVPLPATALLLAPALFGFIGLRRKLKA